MKAVIISHHGERDALSLVDNFENPFPGKGEVLIKVAFSGINHVDLVNRRGYPGIAIPLPHILGSDIAGTVEALGDGVDNIEIGARVIVYPLIGCGACQSCLDGNPNICLNWKFIGLHLNGGYAEYVSVPAENILLLPLSFEEAPAIPVAGLTAYHALKNVGNLREGQTFFIWGGSGGLGSMAIQIAKYLGARVIATASSVRKMEAVTSLGADHVLNRLVDDIPAKVREIAPAGVDLLLDYVGPQTFPISFEMLRKGGTMLLCGIITGRETNFNIHQTYLRHLSIKGLYMGTKGEMQELLSLAAQRKIKPYIGNVLKLEDAAEAHRMMESGESIGKLALKIA
jgi:NADPH2:quinone reductase